MKKIIIILALIFAASTAHAQNYCRFVFDEGAEYTPLSGSWELGGKGDNEIKKYTFDENESDFLPVSGIWNVSDGKYIQSQTGFSALTRSMLPKKYNGFILSFEAVPLSEDNTLMIYFASESGSDGASAEINSYQSKLICTDGEFLGDGGIKKDEKYTVTLTTEKNRVCLYLNGKLILKRDDMQNLSGRVGIGSWNSAFEFDNICAEQISSLGSGKKLVGSGKNAVALLPQPTVRNFEFSAEIAAENIQNGSVGIIARADSDGNGYRLGIDKNGAFISGGEKKQRGEFKARSGKIYTLSALCDEKNITLLIDGKEIVSAASDTFKDGVCGIFADGTTVYAVNAEIRTAEKKLPRLISEGETDYYIDSESGNDLNDGKSRQTAWRSLNRLNYCSFADKDRIYIKGTFEDSVALKDIHADMVISKYEDAEKPIIIGYERVLSFENCSGITLSGLDIRLKHYAKSENSALGCGYGAILVNSPDISFIDCDFKGPGGDTYTAAVETDSIFNEPETENVTFSDFGKNSLCVGGSETDNSDNSHWAYKYMNMLIRKNIISEYRPDDNITRAEFSSMLVSALGLAESEYRGIFMDISADMWYAKKIQTVSDYRYLPPQMTDGGNANAAAPLKRGELAAMAALVSGKISGAHAEFADSGEFSPWLVDYINAANELGLMSADGDGNFNPNKEVTRAEACVVLIKLMEEK